MFEQVVFAARRAMIAGQMRPGDAFPSVRVLSKELKINPNTAHKIVSQLVNEGLLETRPGIGNVVAVMPGSTAKQRAAVLTHEIERLVVEAKRLGIPREDVAEALAEHWDRLTSSDEDVTGGRKGR